MCILGVNSNFRPHNPPICFQTYYIKNGNSQTGKTGPCPNPVVARKWFHVRVKVTANKAEVFLNNEHVVDATPHYPMNGRGGVATWNGYTNIVRFRNYQMHKM